MVVEINDLLFIIIKPGWTHLLQFQQGLSCSSIYKSMVTDRWKDYFVT